MDRPRSTPTSREPVMLDGFNGTWSRGHYSTTPLDHLNDCFNCSFPGRNQVGIRQPWIFSTATVGNVIWHFIARTANADLLLTLDDTGTVRDETNGVILKVWNPIKVNGFTALNVYGRTYLCATLNGRA